jgi:type VI secretion system secreted protein Hcp
MVPRIHSLPMLRFGCVAVLLATALSVRAQDMFMRIGGQAAPMGSQQTTPTLPGESTDPQYSNWISVLGMSHGLSQSGSIVGGGGAGKVSHQDVSITKNLDKTTPSICFLLNSATNVTAGISQPINYVTIDFRKTGTTEVFYRVELQGVSFSSISYGGSSGNALPTDSVTFYYSKIKWSYVKYENGKAQAPITTGWDLVAGKAL